MNVTAAHAVHEVSQIAGPRRAALEFAQRSWLFRRTGRKGCARRHRTCDQPRETRERRRDPVPPDPRRERRQRAPAASRSSRSIEARGCRMSRARAATGTRPPARLDTGSDRSSGSPTSSRSSRCRPEPSPSRDSGANRRPVVARKPPFEIGAVHVSHPTEDICGRRLGLVHARRSLRSPDGRRPRTRALAPTKLRLPRSRSFTVSRRNRPPA